MESLASLSTGLGEWLTLNALRATLLLLIGWWLTRLVTRLADHWLAPRLSEHQRQLWLRLLFWLLMGLFLAAALHQMGFRISVLLGAAGILSVAVGFASQASMSNVISGLFVLSENSFVVGDVIKVGTTVGEVISIDLLSIKLRTFDNLYVRVPNEQILKSEVVTLTKFPIRRYDLLLGIAYHEDIAQARQVLLDVADTNPLCLDEPAPLIILTGFGESSIDIQFSVWASRENFLALKNAMLEEIKVAFDEKGIEIPFPHRTLYIGEVTKPLPIKIIDK